MTSDDAIFLLIDRLKLSKVKFKPMFAGGYFRGRLLDHSDKLISCDKQFPI